MRAPRKPQPYTVSDQQAVRDGPLRRGPCQKIVHIPRIGIAVGTEINSGKEVARVVLLAPTVQMHRAARIGYGRCFAVSIRNWVTRLTARRHAP